MKRFVAVAALFVTTVLLAYLTGCGGGGGGSTPDAPSATTNRVSGVASKGIISGGTVSAYKTINGVRDAMPIATGTTSSSGSYLLDIGNYTGPMLVEITGGTYTDEATGSSRTISPAAPLRVAIPIASSTVSAAITPLTELAVRLAGATLDAATISAANTKVGSLFRLTDIIATQPVAPTTAAIASASTAQRDYTLALAIISQMQAATTPARTVSEIITDLQNGITGSTFNTQTVGTIQNAISESVNNIETLTRLI